MPYTIRKVAKKKCYKLMNKNTKHMFSKCTTKKKAQKQLRLLNAIKYNPSFVPRGRVRTQKTYKK